ncbi:PREDICTED: uncharacterized protein LOC109236766 [Nicotiana attenuata]|uniref:uncharacterized protein LOC109236766 n=1 Tax=Nicotiana attenuata TaxID=49451 RepID=UPI000904E029|nr:PREDICTED: uncharacterized protein LOC109236766 [Nicotiana attenuata]
MGNRINDQESLTFLEKKIRDAVYKVEITVELCLRRIHVADTEDNRNTARSKLCDELEQITKEMDSIQGEVLKFKNDHQNIKGLPATISLPLRSPPHTILDDENTLVGMEDEFNSIRDQLIGQTSELNVVSIVGMGGIGDICIKKAKEQCITEEHSFRIEPRQGQPECKSKRPSLPNVITKLCNYSRFLGFDSSSSLIASSVKTNNCDELHLD